MLQVWDWVHTRLVEEIAFLLEESQLRLLGLKFNFLLLGAIFLYKICSLNVVSQILGIFILFVSILPWRDKIVLRQL